MGKGAAECLVDSWEQFQGGRDLASECASPQSQASSKWQKGILPADEVTCWHPGLCLEEELFFPQAKQTTEELRASLRGRAQVSFTVDLGFDS